MQRLFPGPRLSQIRSQLQGSPRRGSNRLGVLWSMAFDLVGRRDFQLLAAPREILPMGQDTQAHGSSRITAPRSPRTTNVERFTHTRSERK